MRTRDQPRKVAIVLRLSGTAGRDILSGIFRFLKVHGNWQTRLFQMPGDFTPDAYAALEAEQFDGIIASETGPEETARRLQRSTIPLSLIGSPGSEPKERTELIAFTHNDDAYIGSMGARYLMSLGNRRTFGFVPTVSSQYWSTSRQQGFESALKAMGKDVRIFRSPAQAGSTEDLAALKNWLCELPKPAAVMAAWDTRATQVIQMANEAKVKIPRQLAVLGVDNDELLDESTVPPLSSILPNHEMLGFVAARQLSRLMRKGRSCSDTQAFTALPVRLVERESAAASAPAAHLIVRATDYIRRNATKGISADDVARFLGVSRRLVDLRFGEFCNETINEMIVRHRLEAVKKMLATTTRSIKSVSDACGYKDAAYLKTLFKRRFGMTMSAWRQTQFTD